MHAQLAGSGHVCPGLTGGALNARKRPQRPPLLPFERAFCAPPHTQDANVASGLGIDAGTSAVTAANNSLLSALGFGVICIAINLVGLMGGFTLFYDSLNLLHTILHFFGGVLTAWYIVDVWGYLSYWCVRVRVRSRPFVTAGGLLPAPIS